MTQYTDLVEARRLMEKAEEWAKGIKTLHHHKLKTMWYDDRPQDTDKGYVTDVEYNSGLIERKLSDGEIVHFGTPLTGKDLLLAYTRNN